MQQVLPPPPHPGLWPAITCMICTILLFLLSLNKKWKNISNNKLFYAKLSLIKHTHSMKDDPYNLNNFSILLVVNNVILLLIDPSPWAPKTSALYHLGEDTRLSPLPVTWKKTDRLLSLRVTRFLVAICGWSLKTFPILNILIGYCIWHYITIILCL